MLHACSLGAEREGQQEHRAAGRRRRVLGEAYDHEERSHGRVSAGGLVSRILPLRGQKLILPILSLRYLCSAAAEKSKTTKAKKP